MNESLKATPPVHRFPLHRDWVLTQELDSKAIPHMRQAWKKSRKSLAQIRTALQSGPDWPGVETMYVVGSLGRMEQVRGSDCDLVIVLRDDCTAHDSSVARGLDAIWERLQQLGLQPPKANGIYASPTSVAALWNPDSIGQVDESMDVFGKRIQLILEGQPVYADAACERLLQRMLDRYSGQPLPHPSVGSDNTKQWSYLMNDLIRYFRSLCIRTQWLRDPVKWMVLNTKLRHSRLLSYAALLLLLGESSCVSADKVEWLAARTRLTPMERIAGVFFEHAAVEQFARLANCYDTFLASMDAGILCTEPGWQPTSISDCVSHSGYQALQHNSTELIQELLQFVLDRRGDWKTRFFEYLIF